MKRRTAKHIVLWLVSCMVAMDATAQSLVHLESNSSPGGGYELYGTSGVSGAGVEFPSNGVVNVYFQPSDIGFGGAAFLKLSGIIGKSSPIWNTYTELNTQALKPNLLDDFGNPTPAAFSNNAPVIAACGPTAGVDSYATGGTSSGFFYSRVTLAAGGTPGDPCTNSFAFSNLIPSNVYKIVLYATWNAGDAGSKFTIGGVSKTCSGVPSESNAPFVQGQSYVRYDQVMADAQGEIHGTWETYLADSADFHRGPFNGIQIEGNFFNSLVFELKLTELTLNPYTDQVTLRWNSEEGVSYAIDYSDDHQQWTRRFSNLVAAGMETIVVFPEPALNSVPSRSYRVVED